MNDARRLSYLHAMGIDTWVRRPPPQTPVLLRLGPGSGSVLLLCDEAEQSSTPLASDFARYLGTGTAWGWPVSDSEEGGADHNLAVTLEQAIAERLFTTVIVFGQLLSERVLAGRAAIIRGSADILTAADLTAMAFDPAAKRAVWQRLSRRVVRQGKAA